jgi:hypothetical protein
MSEVINCVENFTVTDLELSLDLDVVAILGCMHMDLQLTST